MKIDMVIVTYSPEPQLLIKAIESMIDQVRKIYIVDNTPDRSDILKSVNYKNVEVIYLDDNKGIAYAQNIGIKRSLFNKSDFIVLSDQDTIYPNNYIVNMIDKKDSFNKIAAIAPLFQDIIGNNANEGFIDKSLFGFKKISPLRGYHEIFQTIASGKILNSSYLQTIGLMDEMLFIDFVDLEWCWRANKKGYKIIGNADVLIIHQLGDEIVSLGNKNITLRSPIRHYYITRNTVYLGLYDNSLDRWHKMIIFVKSFKYIIGFSLLSKPHLIHFKYTLLGFWHGITKKLGKFDG